MDYNFHRMTEFDLGSMYLIYNKALVARSSKQILFFKIEVDQYDETRRWI
jgi:hypothetical protein